MGCGLAVLLAGAGCRYTTTFDCTEARQCGDQAVCITGYCAFGDGMCPSGYRYDEYASPELAGQCVPIGGGDAGIDTFTNGSDASIDAPPNSTTYVFGERPSADHMNVTADTYISQDMEGSDKRPFNYGGAGTLKIKAGEEHGLIEFNISAIPQGATVFSATLTIQVSDPGSGSNVSVRPLLEEWVEGTLQGTAGVCNWTQRDTVNLWATAGAGPPGSAGAVVASFQPTAVGPRMIALPVSLVQGWLDPAQNHGVLLIATQDNIDVVSSEGTSTNRPILTVTFVP